MPTGQECLTEELKKGERGGTHQSLETLDVFPRSLVVQNVRDVVTENLFSTCSARESVCQPSGLLVWLVRESETEEKSLPERS